MAILSERKMTKKETMALFGGGGKGGYVPYRPNQIMTFKATWAKPGEKPPEDKKK